MNADLAFVRPATVPSGFAAEFELLQVQVGTDLSRLGGRCRVHIIDSADHTFSQSAAGTALERVLSNALFAPLVAVDVGR
jgi:hypothetical protein